MSDVIIFDRPYGRVLVDAAVPCVMTQWLSFANAPDFIALQEAALLYYEAHATAARPWGFVGDVRHMGAIPAKAQAWLISEFNPRATAAGLREVSVVVSDNVFGQLATQQYAQQTAAQRDRYELHAIYYQSVADAKAGARSALAGR
ncbi:MAG TPA: hypothetical protein VFO93_09185 [Hymenobacter sp.]|uniref:hypothetical protein n=1 Tax=Hymenobacter sp. TaxID=1898978 RepID=UPI002D7F7685|nr:hypothetical protein [Hymenobacter sp.]HET9503703.1 hypothetical protein [Hymenobacter sp.]